MTINSLSSTASTPFVGLATQTYNVLTTGTYTVQVQATIPYQAAGSSADSSNTTGGSSLQILVKLDATTKLTLGGVASNPTPTQPSLSGSVTFAATAGQVITVVPSSAALVDNLPNGVKGVINVFLGE